MPARADSDIPELPTPSWLPGSFIEYICRETRLDRLSSPLGPKGSAKGSRPGRYEANSLPSVIGPARGTHGPYTQYLHILRSGLRSLP